MGREPRPQTPAKQCAFFCKVSTHKGEGKDSHKDAGREGPANF